MNLVLGLLKFVLWRLKIERKKGSRKRFNVLFELKKNSVIGYVGRCIVLLPLFIWRGGERMSTMGVRGSPFERDRLL